MCACVCVCVRVCVCVCVCVCTCTDSWRLCGVIHNVPMFRKLSVCVPGPCMGLVCMFTVKGKLYHYEEELCKIINIQKQMYIHVNEQCAGHLHGCYGNVS